MADLICSEAAAALLAALDAPSGRGHARQALHDAAPDLAATVVALSEERDRLLRDFTGLDAAGWEEERKEHDAWRAAENRGGGVVTCPDCGRGRMVDGEANVDLRPSRCTACAHAAVRSERDRLRAVLGALVERYVKNVGRPSAFIACITPTGIPDYWMAAVEALSESDLAAPAEAPVTVDVGGRTLRYGTFPWTGPTGLSGWGWFGQVWADGALLFTTRRAGPMRHLDAQRNAECWAEAAGRGSKTQTP